MAPVHQKMWDTIGIIVLITLVFFNVLQYHDIQTYQVSMEERLNDRLQKVSDIQETRSLEHRYFMLLHECKENGVIEESELDYYNHLKKFYRIGE